ncbi:T9SS type B sorting domain-containing protein [Muricauda sp. CAU 1633]|uniref:T9SS type B sorting domain-containing protein n=1 Tax=Allomuricauda sp. CAU 1633 TaxID=2816036 RepID=UPI001A8FBACC|nr:T9SS type B sorting domain-containing protein [Muricauda sp. CAU 1633]MBO0322014.1 T9SS type B sorting domain-containing protein [Muricauda sp. CAU 1633]
MALKHLFFGFFSLFSLSLFAQGETSNWYFGNGAGLKFKDDGTVVALTDGKLNTFEGCTTISDTTGNLLFYTDGIVVYDRNHNIMQNGTGLYGDPSSTQSAIIVQKPEDPTIFYIFTMDTITFEGDPDWGFNYSVVDITLNGGNGAVIQKNINLLADGSEKLSAVIKDCFDKSIWVVTLASENEEPGQFFNTYYAFEVNTTGVNPVPVKSTFNDIQIFDPRGYLKFSPDGSILASANGNSGLYLYDFDTDTGLLSNQQKLQTSNPFTTVYGIEFSPNQNFLYVNTTDIPPQNDPQLLSTSLLQFDLEALDISASEIEIDRRPIYRGALQLAQNGKIYRTVAENYFEGSPYLGVIENPNEMGVASNYIHNAVYLEGKNATQGLPPFVQSFFNQVDLVQNADGTSSSTLTLCAGEAFVLEGENLPNATYTWEKDGVPLANSSYNLAIASSSAVDSGRYSLQITPEDPNECPILGEAFIMVDPLPEPKPLLLVQCDAAATNSADGLTTFNLEQAIFDTSYTFYFYESLSDLASENPIPNPIGYTNSTPFNQTLYYKILNSNGCEDTGELQLQVLSIVLTEDEKTFYACDENPEDELLEGIFDLNSMLDSAYRNRDVTLYTTLEDASLEQNPISGDYASSSTLIYARIEENNECEDVDIINLTVTQTPTLNFMDELTWCTDGPPISVTAPDGFDLYRWYKDQSGGLAEIGNQQDLQIEALGNYVLEVGYVYTSNEGAFECTNTAIFEVVPSNKAQIDDILIEDISENNTVEILVSGDGEYEFSLDGFFYQDSALFDNVSPGIITAYVRDKNGCGLSEELISVIGYPKFFTPNGDNVNDFWQIIGVNEQFQPESIISIYDRYGKLVAQISPGSEGWNGSHNNSELPASDYWFSVSLQSGRIFKGHFALKR